MHGGPFSGELLDVVQLPRSAFDRGFWAVRYPTKSRLWFGRYVRDHGSAGGRDWDWSDD